jgi:uncharacterized protein YndB with AHSA1/START domain
MTETDNTTLRLERLIPSPPELLFALFVEPGELVKWWAPDGYEAAVDVVDLRPGGRWRLILSHRDGARLVNSGVYRVIEPPRRLSFSFAWEDASGSRGHDTEVIVSFEQVAGGTRLVLTQQRFESRQARDNHHRGWSACFDRIKTIADE